MENSAATPRPPSQGGPPRSEPGDEPGSTSPVGDMFEEGETDVGPHPDLINLENWDSSDLASSASTAETNTEETNTEDASTEDTSTEDTSSGE